MQTEVEVEYKSVVTKEKYEELLTLLPQFAAPQEAYEQINYFFDAPTQLLNRHGITLRIRNKKGTWQLTAKVKLKNGGAGYAANQELNEIISEEQANAYLTNGLDPSLSVITEMLRLANLYTIEPFQLLGSLTTWRTDFLFYEDTISLDQNVYNGQTDYEMEWETTNHSFISFINQRILQVEFNNASGKRKRFLQSIAS